MSTGFPSEDRIFIEGMIRVWRTTKRAYVDTAFSGEGARLAGGRFNPRGTPLVYTSWALSLSLLEVLTQLGSYEDLSMYTAVAAGFDDSQVKVLEEDELPEDWRSLPAPESTRQLGMAWIASLETLVLGVPSVIIPSEHNYLINPAHADFASLDVGRAEDLNIDPRLLMA